MKKRTSRKKPDLGAPASDRVERMLQLIANSGSDPDRPVLRVSDIAEAVGLHADSASRLFARSVGTGLGAFLTQHRMALAQSLLASTDAKIADIADSAGFGSVSQFHAVFRRHTGMTPDRYRKAIGGEP
jgi:AraC-like DNA-binding protein